MIRKKLAFLCMVVIFLFFSCEQMEDSKLSSTAGTLSIEHTMESIISSSEDANSNKSYPPIVSEPVNAGVSMEYEDTFQSFMKFPSGRGYFFGKVTLFPEVSFGGGVVPFVFFRVIDVEEEYTGDFAIYHVQIVDAYGIQNYNTEKVYRMAWRGHLDEQLYGRPPLEIGEVYGRFLAVSEENLQMLDLWQAGLIYGIEEIEGKQYLYGYGTDLSNIECKIPITDSEENSIYKPGKHDKAISELINIGQELPTFDYKCEIDAFYTELKRRCS